METVSVEDDAGGSELVTVSVEVTASEEGSTL